MEALTQPRKILILDDNSIDRETCRRFLTRGAATGSYRFVEHDSLEGALELALAEKPDCILLDYHLHDGTGVEFLRQLRSQGGTLDHPVVMLTGTGSESIAVEVMKIGAQDYLVKDRLAPEVLQRTIEAAIYKARSERLIDGQRREMERLFREAQEANARKDHFLATLSHELRTPLTPVLAAVGILEEGAVEETDLREIATVIRRNIELEARLIDDMLDLTKISQGKMDIDPKPVDIEEALRCAAEICRQDIQSRGLVLAWALVAERHIVLADEARLQQVFWNLLKNAAKFTPEGGRIELVTENDSDSSIEVTVRDSGIGIEPAHLEKIFIPFEQVELSSSRRFGGLGLGLAICRALVEAHGGTIRARSDPAGIGSEFIVRLKTHDGSAAPAGPPRVPVPPSAPPPPTPTRRVLLVEDHADTSFFFARTLRRLGHEVMTAGCAAEAEKLFAEHRFDCIVSDIGLPDANGADLVARLRARRPVPAIALSGYGMEEDLRRSREVGFSRHLIKPVTSQKLIEAVTEMLNPESRGADRA